MYLWVTNMNHFGKNVYLLKRYHPSDSFCISEIIGNQSYHFQKFAPTVNQKKIKCIWCAVRREGSELKKTPKLLFRERGSKLSVERTPRTLPRSSLDKRLDLLKLQSQGGGRILN